MIIIHGPKKKTNEKNIVLESAWKLFDVRKDIIGFFEKGTFPYKSNVFKTKKEESEESEENKLEKIKDIYKKIIEYIENESKGISYNLFKDYFDFPVPSALAKKIIWDKKEKQWVNKTNQGQMEWFIR